MTDAGIRKRRGLGDFFVAAPEVAGLIVALLLSPLAFFVTDKAPTIIVGQVTIILPVAFLWRFMRWKALWLIPTVAAVDIDHFLTGSSGFFEKPEVGIRILHAFHSIEMVAAVLALNLLNKHSAISKGIRSWLFPARDDFLSTAAYHVAWATRIVLLGVAIHYFMDIFIYTLNAKWGYYDYSIILHYLR